jgi:hypothetical protein
VLARIIVFALYNSVLQLGNAAVYAVILKLLPRKAVCFVYAEHFCLLLSCKFEEDIQAQPRNQQKQCRYGYTAAAEGAPERFDGIAEHFVRHAVLSFALAAVIIPQDAI